MLHLIMKNGTLSATPQEFILSSAFHSHLSRINVTEGQSFLVEWDFFRDSLVDAEYHVTDINTNIFICVKYDKSSYLIIIRAINAT